MQSYPESLKAISIHAPHAYAICMGIKKAEYRSQPTDRRGWILIHASQSKDSDHCFADYGISKDTIKRGAIIGAAQITNCTWDAEYGCYAYHLESPILFDQPIEGVKGCQAIFWGATQPQKQAAFAQAWALIDDISIEANSTEIQQRSGEIEEIAPLAIRGYHLEYEAQHSTEEKQGYRVFAQAELNQYIEQQAQKIAPLPNIQFTSLDDNWEATVDGLSIATISYDCEHLTQRYVVAVGGTEIHRTNTQTRAENYIIWHYKQGTLPAVEETEPCTIEDCNLIDNKGQQYTFRINGQLIGYIWLTETEDRWNNWRQFWINGDGTEYKDWRECGLKLAQLTRKDLYQTVAA
ncbi:MAG: ASCH domain-containing protein [Fischerella sp.]|uniref:ASCH domain-containing protein n=1 Tax=Fischerella sp. TaxID=1191 RepID=UPI0018199229|nr:ASCH domain-containing protein [Fischerella sp.]NWF61785.1 ASCH domain-containing protein [Fischerella sp.]